MRDVSHTPPTGDREVNTVFSRGPRMMTDGGERERSERDPRREAERTDGGERTDGSRSTSEHGSDGGERDSRPEAEHRHDGDDTQRMKDVSHTPPAEDREVDRVFARGHERLASDDEHEHDYQRERVAEEVAEE